MFTGRRLDILDNGSLKIQYNRYRYYDTYTGRFTTHDPLGITPNPQWPNQFDAIDQYVEGMSLYEYARSSPVTEVDSFGLFKIEPPEPCGYFKFDAKPTIYSIKRKPLKFLGCLLLPEFVVKIIVEGELKKQEKHIYKERKCKDLNCFCRYMIGPKCHSINIIYPAGSIKKGDCLITIKLKVNIQTCLGAGICCGL